MQSEIYGNRRIARLKRLFDVESVELSLQSVELDCRGWRKGKSEPPPATHYECHLTYHATGPNEQHNTYASPQLHSCPQQESFGSQCQSNRAGPDPWRSTKKRAQGCSSQDASEEGLDAARACDASDTVGAEFHTDRRWHGCVRTQALGEAGEAERFSVSRVPCLRAKWYNRMGARSSELSAHDLLAIVGSRRVKGRSTM